MDNRKYIGMDVHKEAIAVAVLNAAGKLVMESIIETKANTILEFLKGLRGELHLTFEEGTWASWLYDLLKPHVKRIVVCNLRRNALLKEGSKSDRVDVRKLAELLYTKTASSRALVNSFASSTTLPGSCSWESSLAIADHERFSS